MIVENGGSGGAVAAPVARTVLDAWLHLVDEGNAGASVARAEKDAATGLGAEPL